MNDIVRRHAALLLQQVQLLVALLDAEGLMGHEPESPAACPRCEGALREAVIDGAPGLICAECNTPAPAEEV